MEEIKYQVLEGNILLASDMILTDALMFIEAYLEKYCNENIELKIRECIR